ncbi:TIGR04141 family sporadically distributed protein [Pseudoflavitalea sp. X16]|uniref:DUF6119 family protein n=1 Tax=Paraflavitalea devenefica TaxID=2716334 RepID=UPI001422D536|nr:DUF6119 family protein [Paraflavitalea devenefica]NII29683.1 TIGR04141 family sporadically distributed protein [Paraflavitalea devenefica]
MIKTNKLTVYLVKEGYEDPVRIVKHPADPVVIGEVGRFYSVDSRVRPPAWMTKFFGDRLTGLALFMANAKGVFVTSIEYEGRRVHFALTFGTGRHMLNTEAIEENFGLKVTLNSVDEKSIKSIEKSTIGGNGKVSKEQLSKSSEAKDFGIDIEQDLVRAITGKSKILGFGKTITGDDPFSLSARINVDNLSDALTLCYRQYLSEDYKEHFDWIDQIQHIKNPVLIGELEDVLIQQFNESEFTKLWMAAPDLVNWNDLEGFYYLPGQEEPLDDLYIEMFRDQVGEVAGISDIKGFTVLAQSASGENQVGSWNAYKCLYGEVTHNEREYVLNNGNWYEINNDFVEKVNRYYDNIPVSEIGLPDYDHDDEGAYNTAVAEADDSLLLMDQDPVMHGGGSNKIEFCDLYSKGRKIVHVKHAAASSVLSHLFMQAMNSGEYFSMDKDFRRKLNDKLQDEWKLARTATINERSYEIVIAIISKRGDDRPHIPFFSKVGLKNTVKRLNGFHYRVSIKRIHSLRD